MIRRWIGGAFVMGAERLASWAAADGESIDGGVGEFFVVTVGLCCFFVTRR